MLLFSFLLVSCASDSAKQKDKSTTTAPRKSLSERMGDKNGYKQDSEGNWTVQSDQRSPYESKGTTYDAKKSFSKSTYKTGDFAKKSWWGNKEYDRKSYTGNTDGSRFQKKSPLQGEKAPEAKEEAKIAGPYQTNTYATGTAREASTSAIEKPSNAAIESRQKKFPQPEIIDWKERRSLSVDQSKGILGH
jgi:hypothetical protein